MFSRMLVGIDGSAGSAAALDAALALGDRLRSTIILAAIIDVRVLEAPMLEAAASAWPSGTSAALPMTELAGVLRERSEQLLASAAERVRAAGLPLETVSSVGIVEEELIAHAERAEALVVGRRGELRGPPGIGEHTVKLVRRSPRPVVVAGDTTSAFAQPMVAYDGRETSSAALALAARYAAVGPTSVTVIHVSGDAEQGDSVLAQAGAFLSQAAVSFETRRIEGDVAEAIADCAAASGADVLVCGAHGGRRRSWSIGSHTEKLMRATHLPVIVVR